MSSLLRILQTDFFCFFLIGHCSAYQSYSFTEASEFVPADCELTTRKNNFYITCSSRVRNKLLVYGPFHIFQKYALFTEF